MASWWDPIARAISNVLPPPVPQIESLLGIGQAAGKKIAGPPKPTSAVQAWNQLQKQVPTAAQELDPNTIQKWAQTIAALPGDKSGPAIKAVENKYGTAFAQAIQNAVQQQAAGGTTAGGTAAAQASPYQYGFDPLTMKDIFSQAFEPYLQQNQQSLQGTIAGYGTAMQKALQGANPLIQQAYAQSLPATQQALSAEAQGAGTLAVMGPEYDQLLTNLADATSAAKTAQTTMGSVPYLSYLYQQAYGAGGAGGAGSTGPLGLPTSGQSPAAGILGGTAPTQYGFPGAPTGGPTPVPAAGPYTPGVTPGAPPATRPGG